MRAQVGEGKATSDENRQQSPSRLTVDSRAQRETDVRSRMAYNIMRNQQSGRRGDGSRGVPTSDPFLGQLQL